VFARRAPRLCRDARSVLLVALAAICCAPGDRPHAAQAPSAPPTTPPASAAPAPLQRPRIVQIACGDWSTCALLDDGTARCWGTLYMPMYGDAVDPAQAHSATPVAVAGLRGATAIALGTGYVCAIAGGAVLCWGNNGSGQLGDGTTKTRYAPAPVPGVEGATALALAPEHACGLRGGGTVTCWGASSHGALGRAAGDARYVPAPVEGLRGAVAIGAGHEHTCAVIDDGSVRCWGANRHGEIGDGSTAERPSPTPVRGLAGAVEIALGGASEVPVERRLSSASTCARLGDGTVSCWGDNRMGQLGDGTTIEQHRPTLIGDLRGVLQIASGTGFTCARLGDGTVSCWGDNRAGQLGDGTTTRRLRPTPVPGLRGVVEIAARGFHTCARTEDGRVLCWGSNRRGELGDGSSTREQATPVPVPGASGPPG
jgi:alpha-tubulin suppressor-like RCC1 family protein